ncbi:hypothetical protein BYT27DRAFT_7263187 [Phlegmacium glaucopus]|nr:hypothetical protein BYT27DRAFT_7263187 [Phlegmacium glaucopus]
MADRIAQNPHLETLPNHSGPHYDALRALLIATGISEDEAILSLNQTWTNAHSDRIIAWDQQVQNDVLIQEEATRVAQEHEKEIQAQREKNLDDERRKIEKKKPKMNDFDMDQAIDDFIIPWPATFALRRIDDFEFVELWYFSQEGCVEASTSHRTQNEDAFSITKVNDMLSLRPVASLKASKNVIPDMDLSWRQMTIARTTLVQHLTNQWPAKHIQAMVQFFMNLEVHPYRHRPFGERSLLIYQARARRNWHDQLKQNRAFNIAIINETLLQTIHREVLDNEQMNMIQVSSVIYPLL